MKGSRPLCDKFNQTLAVLWIEGDVYQIKIGHRKPQIDADFALIFECCQ